MGRTKPASKRSGSHPNVVHGTSDQVRCQRSLRETIPSYSNRDRAVALPAEEWKLVVIVSESTTLLCCRPATPNTHSVGLVRARLTSDYLSDIQRHPRFAREMLAAGELTRHWPAWHGHWESRPSKQISLSVVRAGVDNCREFVFRLDAFGDDARSQLLAQ